MHGRYSKDGIREIPSGGMPICAMLLKLSTTATMRASVAYIAATPRTEENKSYIKRQLENFLNGIPPEDFQKGPGEKTFKMFTGEAGILGGEAGRRAMGFDLIA